MTSRKRSRFLWNSPYKIGEPWLFGFFKGSDEQCNPSIGIKFPFLGLLWYFHGKDFPRTRPCDECADLWGD